MEIKGRVKFAQVREVTNRNGETAHIVDVVLEYADYGNIYSFVGEQYLKPDVERYALPMEGDEVVVQYQTDAREWRDKDGRVKWFGSNKIWRIEPAQQPTA